MPTWRRSEMETQTAAIGLAHQLRTVPVFADLSDQDLLWLAARMELFQYDAGDVIITEGAPADRMMVLLAGETRGQREHAIGDGRTYSVRAPSVTGMLPYSRLTHVPLTLRAMMPATIAFLSATHFPEMLDRMPALRPKLVGVL